MQKETVVISKEELRQSIGIKGFLGKWIAGFVYWLLELKRVNYIQNKHADKMGPDFSDAVLEECGISIDYIPEQLSRIPAEGGFITVSNHHFGSIDGMILSSLVGHRRPDFKLLTTLLLAKIPSLQPCFLPVANLSSSNQGRSVAGIRMALEQISRGEGLGFFPAGEVATYQKKGCRSAVSKKKVVEDIPWADNIIKVIKKSKQPVVPIYFQGQNSKMFHFLGKIHPRLRTVRLIHEMFNKPGTTVKVRFGQPITPEEIAVFGNDIEALGKYLRNRTYALEAECLDPKPAAVADSAKEPIIEAVDPAIVHKEIHDLGPEHVLFEIGDYRIYLTPSALIPNTMRDIARQREETFRAIGEGTGLSMDTDIYDKTYYQLIIWSIPNDDFVGAERIGIGHELVDKDGIQGFYSASEFEYQKGSEPLLSTCMEIGRTFISRNYQREVLPMKIFFASTSVIALKFPRIKYLMGPVTISDAMPDFYKSLIEYYITHEYPYADAESFSRPPVPFKPDYLAVDPDALLAKTYGNIDEFDRLLATVSDGKYRLPVLMKRYFKYSARSVCFNVDPLFNNCLDCLILLRLADYPKDTLEMLLKSIPEDMHEPIRKVLYGEA